MKRRGAQAQQSRLRNTLEVAVRVSQDLPVSFSSPDPEMMLMVLLLPGPQCSAHMGAPQAHCGDLGQHLLSLCWGLGDVNREEPEP